MTNKELFTLYMRAYTSKKAADDSPVDDIAVGAGSAAAGGFTSNLLLSKNVNRAKNLLGKINARIHDTKLEQTRVNNILKDINDHKNRIFDRLNKLSDGNKFNIIPDIEEARTLHDRLKYQNNYENYYSKISKNLGDRVNSLLSRRPLYKLKRLRKLRLKGTAAGAAITGILGSLLYNKLNEA